MVGRSLSHFRVLDEIGRGGMGVVYRAHDVKLDRDVALKVLPPGLVADAGRKARFLKEARAAAALSDPHIAVVHEVDEVEGVTFIAMELLRGEKLSDALQRERLPVARGLDLVIQIAEGLATAHDHGIVHRDLKPANIVIDEHGHAKLIDFGLAKLREPAGPAEDTATAPLDATAAGVVMGTVAYMSPEQARGSGVDARADIWSLGVVLYEMLAGRRPFDGASASDVISAILRDPPPPLAGSMPVLPSPADVELPRIVARCLAKELNQRYGHAGDLVADLQGIRRHLDETPAGGGGHPIRRMKARVAAGVSVTAFVVAVVIGWAVLSRRPALAFRERDFVLVADVVNRTGEPVFDLALKSAIETDLRQSRFVNVYDAAQAQNMLRMMRLSPESRIDEGVGRDLCRRAGVRVLIVPQILKAGEAYQVGVALVEPSTGRVVEDVKTSVQGREQVLLTAIDAVTRDLRKRLGESLDSIARSDPPFAQFTSSSLEALDLLAVAKRAWDRGEFDKAERAYRQALEHDPRFAAARASLGLLLIQFLGRAEEGKAELARALSDSDEVSKREHLHIRALNRQFVAGDLQGALEDFRFLSELYPDTVAPHNNSGRILEALGRLSEAAAMYDRAHEKDPNAVAPLYNAYYLRAGRLRDPAGTERVARALVALQPDFGGAAHTLAWSFVMQRRFAEAEEGMRAVLKLDPENPYALPNLAHLLLRRGAVTEAVEVYRRLGQVSPETSKRMNPDHDALCSGLALRAAGQEAEGRSVMQAAANALLARSGRTPIDPSEQATWAALLAGAGRTAEARSLLARAERADRELKGDALAWRARAHATLGDEDTATALFVRAVGTGYDDPYIVLIDPTLAAIRDRPEIDRLIRADAGPPP